MKLKFLATLVVYLAVGSAAAWGWGRNGHEIVDTVAVRLLPQSPLKDLLKNNIEAVRFLCMTPDLNWKHGANPHPLEGGTHFFTVDKLDPSQQRLPPDVNVLINKFGLQTMIKLGTAPWRMQQFSQLLYASLSKNAADTSKIIMLASTLGHYVGDLGNPLHVNSDYDGKAAGVPGLHSYFESTTLAHMDLDKLANDVETQARQLLTGIPNNITPIDGAAILAFYGNQHAQDIFKLGQRFGLTSAFQTAAHDIIVRTLAGSAAVLAKIWFGAWLGAGSPDLQTDNRGKIPAPDWIPVDYLPHALTP